MSIPPIDNTQKFLDRQANSSPEKTPVSPDFTDTLDAGGRRIVQEMSKISADPSGIRINISPSRIEEKILNDLNNSTLGNLLYNASATLFNNLLMLELTSKPTASVESREKAIVSVLANLVLLSLGAEPSLLEGVKVKDPVLKDGLSQDYDISLKDHYTTYPVKKEDNLMQVSPATNKIEGNSAEAQVLFTTDPSGAVTELSGTYKGPRSAPKQIPSIILSEPINLQQIGKKILLSSKT
jgi:hypothetical protein